MRSLFKYVKGEVFWASCQVMVRADEKRHRGTEGTKKAYDLYLHAFRASVLERS